MDISVIDPEKGSSLSKVQINCGDKTLALPQWIDYDEAGEVVDSYTAPEGSIRYRETVPESVGELRVELACMIK